MSQAAAIPIASVPYMWELHGHVGRTDPCQSCLLLEPGPSPCCGWVLVPAVLQQELILSPPPQRAGGCRALVQLSQLCWGKTRQTQAMGRAAACIEQWMQPPVLPGLGTGQPLSPAPSCSGQPGAISHAWGAACPWPLSQGAAQGCDMCRSSSWRGRMWPSGSQWVSFAICHPSARRLKLVLTRLLIPGTSQRAAEQEDAPQWASPEPAPVGHRNLGAALGRESCDVSWGRPRASGLS